MALHTKHQLMNVFLLLVVFILGLHLSPFGGSQGDRPSRSISSGVPKHNSTVDKMEKIENHVEPSKNLQERQRLSELLQTWPENKPKAAVYYLLSDRYPFIHKSLTLLHKFFIKKYNYPVIIFHERKCDTSKIKKMLNNPSLVDMMFFQEITFQIPEFNVGHVRARAPCSRDLGYRHMCRFQAKGFSDQPIMKELDYIWRLDDDSFVLDELTYDPFRYMQDKKLLYGYNCIHKYISECVVGLWNAAEVYAKVRSIKVQSPWPEAQEYYNNFEISAMSLWRSKAYRAYFDYIDRLGGIYWHRWGDAPIKSLAVAMFVPIEKRHYFDDVPYNHKNTTHLHSKHSCSDSLKAVGAK